MSISCISTAGSLHHTRAVVDMFAFLLLLLCRFALLLVPQRRPTISILLLQGVLPEILNANYLMLHQAVNFWITSAKEVTISVLQEGQTIKGVLFRVFSC